jgi:hypothetical protein
MRPFANVERTLKPRFAGPPVSDSGADCGVPMDGSFSRFYACRSMRSKAVPRRAIGYVRVSVDHERKVSPAIQAEAIEQLCAVRGWNLVHVEVERGRSAGTAGRGRGNGRVLYPSRKT